ncbi:MAG: P-II family nitrogen regulator [Christensenellales bacterium]|jgi:nitrogen regulatory protein PII
MDNKLIVAIVKEGLARKVIDAAKESGAEGSTVIYGAGMADESVYRSILGLDYNPEKEIILIGVCAENADKVFEAAEKVINAKKSDTGIVFMLKLNMWAGICHKGGINA